MSTGSSADDTLPDWQGQLYGGEYYSDKRVGVYGIASTPLANRLSFTTELLLERYHNGQGDYDSYGAGGHLLWTATDFAKFGLTGSLLRDSYNYDDDFEDPKSEYDTHAFGLEGELNHDALTLAIQAGLASSDYYNGNQPYFATDAYYWGQQGQWYARAAARRSKGYKELTLEAYHSFETAALPVTLYAGGTRADFSTREELRTTRAEQDSLYVGGWLEFLTTTSSRWSLWAEAARGDADTLYTLELTITLGPGVDTPYLSAVDFIP